MNKKLCKRLGAVVLSAAIAASSIASAGACTSLYIGGGQSANGSTYVGRSEDIGKLYDKVFEVREAADHAEGELYEDAYGFSMLYPAHTYRYTVVRDSINSYDPSESIVDEDGALVHEAYGEAGMNEKGVFVSATVSTYYNDAVDAADPVDGGWYGGICEISLASVILMQAESARDGVEKLAAIIDECGAGECNSLTIGDANEVWDFEIVSGHQYVALKMPADKVSVNPNMMVMDVIDVSDTENVVASDGLISLPLEYGFLVSPDYVEGMEDTSHITTIDIAETYSEEDSGSSQYERYWQGVNYLNEALSGTISIEYGEDDTAPEGPFDMLFDADRKLTTYEVLRLLAYRGEGTEYDANTDPYCYAVGNEYQAECHIFETRPNMPEALATIQWQAMSRAEFSVYLPFYSSLLTDTSDIFKTEFGFTVDEDYNHYYDIYYEEVTTLMEYEDWPEDSIQWAFIALNDLCDNDRERYGTNVKAFWENYQKALIEQQADVDAAMEKIYAYSPELAEEKATALAKAVSEEAFGYAKEMLGELLAFIAKDEAGELIEADVFTPTVLTENKLPTYSINMEGVGGTGIPSSTSSSSSGTSTCSLTFTTNGGSAIPKVYTNKGATVDLSQYQPTRDGYTFDGWYADSNLTEPVTSVKLDANTTVYAKWVQSEVPAAEENSFNDVASTAWYAEAVGYVKANNIMSGTGTQTFSPDANLTRGMIAQVLYSMENQPAASGSAFTDVDADAWYADAVNWAAANQIVSGYGNGEFGPNDSITREQLVSILFRYAQFKGYDVSVGEDTNILSYTDANAIAEYAIPAMQWACGAGLISGKDNGILDPQGNATRAEIAQILMNFCEKIAK